MTSPAQRPFSRLEHCRLWLSYQRYAILLAGTAIAIVGSIAMWAPRTWWLWLLAVVPVIKLVQFAGEVYRRYPRKLRATVLAVRRIEAGRFRSAFVENYCGDPCFRVVAREILVRARVARAERQRLIKEFARRVKSRSDVVLLVDRQRGVHIRVTGSHIERMGSETVQSQANG